MRNSFKWAFALFGLALCVAIVFALVNASKPLVPAAAAPNAAERRWAREWLRDNDPRRHRVGDLVTLTLSEHEINLLANYLLGRLGPGRALVRLEPGIAQIRASLGLPWSPSKAFLNATLRVRVVQGAPEIDEARIAGLPMPAGLVKLLAGRAMEGVTRVGLLRQLSLRAGEATVVYEWRPDSLDAIGTHLLPEDEQGRLGAYQTVITDMTHALPRGRGIALADLLTRLMATAASRSADGDAAAENRAVLAVAAAYVNGRTIRKIDSGPISGRRPRFYRVTLRGRRDLAQHFTASAALAAQGGSVFSDAVGLFKELTDTDGGSGFSFVDLAADRAGVRFAELATGSETGAKRVQRAALEGLGENDFMPQVKDLPESLTKDQFERDYGGTQDRRYQALVERIDRRIAGQRLYSRRLGNGTGPG